MNSTVDMFNTSRTKFFFSTDFQEDMDSEYSPLCSDIEDNAEDDDEKNAKTKKDLEKQDMSVMKLLETYSQLENDIENHLPIDEDDKEMDLSGKIENL